MQLIKPVSPWRITQDFGANPAYYAQFGQIGHSGIDIGVPTGTPVYAAADGTIEYEGDGKNLSYMGAIAGICCVINHGTIMTGYAHLSNTVVNKGQKVKQGQLIGHSGNTGTSTGAHLHFEVISLPMNTNNGYYGRVDPNPYLTGGSMLTTKTQLNNMYTAVLRRTRGTGEGEDVYLNKDSGFVFDDLYKSPERATRLAQEAADKKALNDKVASLSASLLATTNKLDLANKEIATLKANPVQTGTDATAKDTNEKVNWLVNVIKSIFNRS